MVGIREVPRIEGDPDEALPEVGLNLRRWRLWDGVVTVAGDHEQVPGAVEDRAVTRRPNAATLACGRGVEDPRLRERGRVEFDHVPMVRTEIAVGGEGDVEPVFVKRQRR